MPWMELPVATLSSATAPDALIRAIKRADTILARTGAEENALETATAFANSDRPAVAALNRAFDLRLSEGVEPCQVIDEVQAFFTERNSICQGLDTNESSWPVPLAQAVAACGFAVQSCTVHVLTGHASAANHESLQIIPARAAYAESRQLFRQQAIELPGAAPHPDTNTDTFADAFADSRIDFLDESRVDCFLARHNRQPVGHISLLTLGNVGVLLDLFAMDDDDHTIADALLARLIDHCQRAQFEQVITRTAEGDRYRSFLEDCGFKPRVNYERYVAG